MIGVSTTKIDILLIKLNINFYNVHNSTQIINNFSYYDYFLEK
jgi:hypothetical protein